MNNKFDELVKGVAQSVTRRQALKKFGVSLAGAALACFGLRNIAEAAGNSETHLCCLYRLIQCGGGDCEYTECASARRGCKPPPTPDFVFVSQTPVDHCTECISKTPNPRGHH